jgi:hypothetical protein
MAKQYGDERAKKLATIIPDYLSTATPHIYCKYVIILSFRNYAIIASNYFLAVGSSGPRGKRFFFILISFMFLH